MTIRFYASGYLDPKAIRLTCMPSSARPDAISSSDGGSGIVDDTSRVPGMRVKLEQAGLLQVTKA
jgi:hypothetical protein